MYIETKTVLGRADTFINTVSGWPLFQRSGVVPSGVTVLTPSDGLRLVESEGHENWYLQQQGRMRSALIDELVGMRVPNVLEYLAIWSAVADRVRPRISKIAEDAWASARPDETGATSVLPLVQWDLIHLTIESAFDFDFGNEASYRWSGPIYRAGYVAVVRAAGKERKQLVGVCAF